MKKILLLIFILSSLVNVSQNVNLSNLNTFEGEPYIAINPTNPKNMVVAWMGFVFGNGTGLTIKVKNTFNRGQTWSSAINLPHLSPNFTSADVSMAFDASGKLFLTYIDYRQSPDSGAVYLTKSLNGGVSWSTPTVVITAFADGTKTPLDRPWLVTNSTGTNLFLTTKPAPWKLPPNRPYFISSTNGGTSFNAWRYLDTTNYLVGSSIASPMAAPAIIGNTIIAAYPSYVPSQNILPQFILAKTVNNGGTFSYKTILTQGSLAASNDSAKAVYKLLANPINSNHYVFIFIGSLAGIDLDVLLTETFNGGNSWSAPVRVNDDVINNGKMQDLAWANFDTNGDLVITWRDRRNGTGPGFARASEIYGAFKANGSSTFTPNFKISNTLEAYGNLLFSSGNDMMCVELKNDTLNAVWGTTRDGSLDIWFSRIKASTGGVTSLKLLQSESTIINTFPNPSNDIVTITVNNNQVINLVEMHSVDGKLIYSQNPNNNKTSIDLSHFATGVYQLTVYQNKLKSSKKIIKQ
jgi:hypothetical protein